MALSHPKSRKDKYRKEHKPNSGDVFGSFFKRTIKPRIGMLRTM